MSTLDLREVTLVAIDTRTPLAALSAMNRCQAHIRFGDALLVTLPGFDAPELGKVRVVAAPDIRSSRAYSEFVIRVLPDLVQTSHVLIVQWDGFVTHPENWSDSFLETDYIGAPWPQFRDGRDVGNGGFSLRSSRLMHAVRRRSDGADVHPEDVWICRTLRADLEREEGLRFAPSSLAYRFSVERGGTAVAAFGCHGLSNMADALPAGELASFVKELPRDVFGSTECRGFVKRLLVHREWDVARYALRCRWQVKGASLGEVRLWLRYGMARLRAMTARS